MIVSMTTTADVWQVIVNLRWTVRMGRWRGWRAVLKTLTWRISVSSVRISQTNSGTGRVLFVPFMRVQGFGPYLREQWLSITIWPSKHYFSPFLFYTYFLRRRVFLKHWLFFIFLSLLLYSGGLFPNNPWPELEGGIDFLDLEPIFFFFMQWFPISKDLVLVLL